MSLSKVEKYKMAGNISITQPKEWAAGVPAVARAYKSVVISLHRNARDALIRSGDDR
jgi:hypothetical protein